jgi:hypothetical protein
MQPEGNPDVVFPDARALASPNRFIACIAE